MFERIKRALRKLFRGVRKIARFLWTVLRFKNYNVINHFHICLIYIHNIFQMSYIRLVSTKFFSEAFVSNFSFIIRIKEVTMLIKQII